MANREPMVNRQVVDKYMEDALKTMQDCMATIAVIASEIGASKFSIITGLKDENGEELSEWRIAVERISRKADKPMMIQ